MNRENRMILDILSTVVDPLNRSLPGRTEVTLHDLAKMPHSTVAVAGRLTGRRIGDPPMDAVLQAHRDGTLDTLIGYESALPDGKPIRSSTVVIRNSAGEQVAALCIDSDVTVWAELHEIAQAMLPGARWPGRPEPERADPGLDHAIDELASGHLEQAIASVGVPVELMHKKHKLAIVDDLKRRGFFKLKESVDTAAGALGVTRFTVYNYLNELDQQDPGPAPR